MQSAPGDTASQALLKHHQIALISSRPISGKIPEYKKCMYQIELQLS